ncbi:MAG: hypothetical protein PHE12_00545 [Clostridia bacterium]|nr:hypothetical protein [Clostridia bacterium]
MNSKIVARYGIIVALIICAYYVDVLISWGISMIVPTPIRIAVTSLIVVLTICQLFDFKTAVFATTVFGVSSFLFAYIHPNLTASFFQNPLVSIFPRIMIGIVSYSVYFAINKVFQNKNVFLRDYATRSIAGAAGIITNTLLVITMMQLVKTDGDVFGTLLQVLIGIFFIIELCAGLLVVPVVSKTVKERINI